MNNLNIRMTESIQEIGRKEWNKLTGTENPFVRFEFLSALETTQCTTRKTGWQPSHIVAADESGHTVGLVPAYLKYHSYGEYVFDWAWADAYQRNGFDYYPKLLTSIPFTPSVGPRIFALENLDKQLLAKAVFNTVSDPDLVNRISSWHMLFPNETTQNSFERCDLLKRTGSQFHWCNRGYSSFSDFLDSLTSRKRKNIRKERENVARQGVEFIETEGKDISDQALEAFFLFYQATYLKRGQSGYLNLQFFQRLCESMPEQLLLIMVTKKSKYVAGALFLKNETTLFGRYWGCLEEFDNLHFETCYYQGIDYCIKNNIQRFDAGAQGEHKIIRGFEPIPTYSLHWIKHPDFSAAIADFLELESPQVRAYIEEAKSILPYKQDPT